MNIYALTMPNVNHWFPSNYNRGPNLLVWVALIASFVAVFIKLWTPTSLNRWPEAISTLLFIYPLVTNWQQLKKNILLKLWALAIVAPFVFFGINYLLNPEQAVKYADFEKLARIYLFFPMAWWLAGNKRSIGLLFLVAVLGLLFAIVTKPEFIDQLHTLTQGKRVDYALEPLNAQHVGLLFSLVLIGCLSYFSYWGIRSRLWLSGSLGVLVIISLISIWGSQTRAAILGLLVSGMVLFIRWLFKCGLGKSKGVSKQTWNKTFVTLVVCAVIGLGVLAANRLVVRFAPESETLNAIVHQQWDDVPYSSIGIRINTWIEAIEWIKEKPIIGYGGKVRKDVISQSPNHPEWVKERFGHLHNSFIEMTLGYGVLGTLLAFAPFIIGFSNLKRAEPPMQKIFIYSSTLFLVMSCFESYMFFWVGPYLLTIILGTYFSSIYFRDFKN
ncbi:O-antigen ligase family protein [Reinekea marinisedimentorum]|uniref:O-antigen ligase n=1 Tax=Reinekea marinisedimentorum TaxID=230495 RepID=A0A4R3I7X4_9GAMM|nr:O-antigen ligase family protein [Reinekea marinisedimentorum]TCS41921.1 O-antigen ligase [Reinekea marinisedimentorum]